MCLVSFGQRTTQRGGKCFEVVLVDPAAAKSTPIFFALCRLHVHTTIRSKKQKNIHAQQGPTSCQENGDHCQGREDDGPNHRAVGLFSSARQNLSLAGRVAVQIIARVERRHLLERRKKRERGKGSRKRGRKTKGMYRTDGATAMKIISVCGEKQILGPWLWVGRLVYV